MLFLTLGGGDLLKLQIFFNWMKSQVIPDFHQGFSVFLISKNRSRSKATSTGAN